MLAGCLAFAAGLALAACDDASPSDESSDAARLDAVDTCTGRIDCPNQDGFVDARIGDASGPGADSGPDAHADAVPVDAEVPDAAVEPGQPCVSPPTDRPAGAWGVVECRLARVPEPGAPVLSGPPRAVVLGGDVIDRASRSPRHTATEYADLAAVGVELVWLLAPWDGMEPQDGAYNGAWFGRTCEQIGLAEAAGIDVVLAVYQSGFGPALGGVGIPAWATPAGLEVPVAGAPIDHPSYRAAWRHFWAEGAPRLLVAWDRLLATCPGARGVVGLMPMSGPLYLGDAESRAAYGNFAAELEVRTEAIWGPLVVFHPPESGAPSTQSDGPADHAWAAPAPGSSASGGLPALPIAPAVARFGFGAVPFAVENPELFSGLAMDALTGTGAAMAVFEDGFATAGGLRNNLGRPTPRLAQVFGRPWPRAIAGALRGFSGDLAGDGFEARWYADGRNDGASRFWLGEAGAAAQVSLEPDGPFTWFSGFDPVTGELTVFVQGDAGEVALRVSAP